MKKAIIVGFRNESFKKWFEIGETVKPFDGYSGYINIQGDYICCADNDVVVLEFGKLTTNEQIDMYQMLYPSINIRAILKGNNYGE